MDIIIYICIAVIVTAAVSVGGLLAVQRATARSRAKSIVEDAEREAEVVMKNKLLEAREQELKIKSEAEKQANQRMQRVQVEESKIKQRQAQLNQQQSDNARARNENEQVRQNLEAQMAVVEQRKEELDVCAAQLRTLLNISPGCRARKRRRSLSNRLKMRLRRQPALI